MLCPKCQIENPEHDQWTALIVDSSSDDLVDWI